jgi:hypothetical protein
MFKKGGASFAVPTAEVVPWAAVGTVGEGTQLSGSGPTAAVAPWATVGTA